MRRSKLILLDGISGSGKSTTGQRLYRILHLAGQPVEFFHEFHRPHPLLEATAETIDGWIEESLRRWSAFCDRLAGEDRVAIVDGAIFQCGVGELLERDAGDQIILEFIERLQKLIAPLQPVLVHLYQQDIDGAIKRVGETRPKSWRNRVETMFNDTAYGRARTLKGFDLYLDFTRNLRRLADEVFDCWTLDKLAIENSEIPWDDQVARIGRFLEIETVKDSFRPLEYCGEYLESGGDGRCTVGLIGGGLQVQGLFKIVKGLLPKENDTLFVQTWPDELTFERDVAGKVTGFRSTGPWNRIGDGVWRRR
jgi:thymidylate kinase